MGFKRFVRRAAERGGVQIRRVGSVDFGEDVLHDVRHLFGTSVTTLFDVGANEGQTALDMATRFPDAAIWSFEPDPATHARLVENTKSRSGVRAFALALSDSDGAADLHLARNTVGNSLLPFVPDIDSGTLGTWTEEVGRTEVPVRRLDGFCEEHGIERIDLLKTDTQGADLRVLEGAGSLLTPATVRAVVCEVLFMPLYAEQADFDAMYAALIGRGYRLVGLYNPTRDERGALTWADALFV